MKRTLCGVMVACKAIIGVLEFVVIKGGVCKGFRKGYHKLMSRGSGYIGVKFRSLGVSEGVGAWAFRFWGFRFRV